jgi:hypothetical protein
MLNLVCFKVLDDFDVFVLILVNQALGIEPKMGLKTKVFEILGNKVE